MGVTKREALKLLVTAHAAATHSGLFDELVGDCYSHVSVNDVCDVAELYDMFLDFCIDHMVQFNAIPVEFEHQDRVYDKDWCWRTAEMFDLTKKLRKET